MTFVGTIEAGHSIFYKSEANLIQHMAHMGVANMRRYYFEGDKLASHEFMEEDITGMEIDYTQVTNYYKDAKVLRYYSIYLDFPFMLADETPVSTATDLSENEVKQILSYVIDKNAKVHPAKGDTDPYLNTYISFNEFVEFGTSFTKNTMKEQQWIDLNGDGQIECLLRWEDESQGNSYIILSLQDHTVYAYQLYQMFDGKFKEDGSFANGTMTSRFIFDKTQLYQMYE